MDKQDIMRFLKTIESDAVRKLLQLIPVVYGVSLFFVLSPQFPRSGQPERSQRQSCRTALLPSHLGRADAERHEVSVDGLKKAVVSIKDAKDKEMQDNVAEYMDSNEGYEYFIALSSYNDVLEGSHRQAPSPEKSPRPFQESA